jgi:hypothetical protein
MTAAAARPIRPLPDEMKDFQQVAFICNISKEPVLPINHASFGIFHIAVPGENERYALTQIDWAPTYMDKGDSVFNIMKGPQIKNDPNADNRIKGVQGARGIALDLCQQMNTSDGPADESATSPFWGKFVCDGDLPTEKELVHYEAKMRAYFLRVIKIGDTVWAASGRHDLIDGRCKVAAKYLKITDRKWLMDYVPNTTCPACKESIIEGATLCRFCGTILDPSAVVMEGSKRGRGKNKSAAQALSELPTL